MNMNYYYKEKGEEINRENSFRKNEKRKKKLFYQKVIAHILFNHSAKCYFFSIRKIRYVIIVTEDKGNFLNFYNFCFLLENFWLNFFFFFSLNHFANL